MNSIPLEAIEDEHYSKEVNGVLVEITTFRGEHCDEVRVREVKSGRVSLFRKGILQRTESHANNTDGIECTEYTRGKACFYRHLPPLRNTGDVRCIQNCRNGLQLVVEGKGVIYRGGFDNKESMKREGRGMEFDKESGLLLRCGVWENDALIRIEKEFESEDVMIEYDITKGCNRSALDCYPVYEGGYVMDEDRGECVRDGEGCEIDASTGVAVREGRWERGELVESVELYNGWYVNTDNQNPFAWGLSKHDECDLANGVETTAELLIPSNCRNDPVETRFDVSGWKGLNRIAIGDDCFKFVEEVKGVGADELKSVVIGKRSFTKWKNGFGNNPSRCFCLQNCSSLTELKIGNYSFSDYTRFRVENLPSLEVLEVGDWNDKSWCFYWADLELRNLPKLKTVRLGGHAFECCERAVFENLPELTSIELGMDSLRFDYANEDTTLVLQDLPQLRSISTVDAKSKSFRNPRHIRLNSSSSEPTSPIDLPHLTTVTLSKEMAFFFKEDVVINDTPFLHSSRIDCGALESFFSSCVSLTIILSLWTSDIAIPMVQFFYHLNGTKVGESQSPLVSEVKFTISEREQIPQSEFVLFWNGRLLNEEDSIPNLCDVQVSMRLLGGKGGFGAMLKKKAKVSNPNATLDFSACRDLNGRRMLVVNATVAIQKWKERLDKLEELKASNPDATLADVPMEAPKAGIYGWYCEVPKWAEGVKRSRTKYLHEQKKQKMCMRWWKAHESGNVPPDADKHYGCPRRDMCDFAHGLDELTGEGREEFLRELAKQKKEKEQEAIESYVNYQSMADDAVSAIDAGMKLKKAKTKTKRDLTPLSFDEFDTMPAKKAKKVSTEAIPFSKRLSLLSGSATIQDDGIVYATSEFPTVRLGNIAVVCGSYYFEVHIVSEGLVQLGWCGRNNECDEAQENGVGDDPNSWGFDTARGKKWNGEESEEYGAVCQPGDVVGCLLDADRRTMSYSINGKDFGVAFSNVSALGGVFPALSLEKGESVLVNVGQFQFEYPPSNGVKSVWEFVKKVAV